ncbi:MAG: recombinase RecA [Candidatus Wallbacteria bacterium]|nr:recombinase RecA [Candidatus Wallbacteria bacterium]
MSAAKNAATEVVIERKLPDEKKKALDIAIAYVQKQFGRTAIMRLGDKDVSLKLESVPTGILTLDKALGVGGFPRGRIIEIFGPESSGKTTLALHAVAASQKLGGVAAFIDVEHALDPDYAKLLGVDTDNLLVSQPSTGEEALEIAETLIRSGGIDIIALDSVAALVTKAEIEGEMGDAHIALQARLMSQALRKLTGAISKSKAIMIFINQIREKPGIMYGNPETTPGGRALKFYSSIRVEVKRCANVEKGGEMIGTRVRAKVVKNKVAPPFKSGEFEIIFGEGISITGMVVDLATEYDIIQKSGAWYNYDKVKLGQGRDTVKEFFRENPEVYHEISEKVRLRMAEK